MEHFRRPNALLGAAEREGGLILEPRFESRAAESILLLGWPGQQGTKEVELNKMDTRRHSSTSWSPKRPAYLVPPPNP
jgi:hypothetical protein